LIKCKKAPLSALPYFASARNFTVLRQGVTSREDALINTAAQTKLGVLQLSVVIILSKGQPKYV
jgi:hypothetical protein